MLNIVTIPNKILTKPSQQVKKIDQSVINLIKQMRDTLDKKVNPQGVGLAAPQVGTNLAVFIIKPKEKTKIEAFINPRIVKLEVGSWKLENIKHHTSNLKGPTSNLKLQTSSRKTKLEGCLSIPKIWAPVARAKKVLLEYHDVSGKQHKRWFSGFKAAIIQHEVDHLNGILFTQRALEQNAIMYEEKEGKLVKFKSL